MPSHGYGASVPVMPKKALKAAQEIVEKIPYKVKSIDDGAELALESSKARASAEFRDLDTIEQLDPEMIKHLEKLKAERPIYIPILEAEKGYGAKALSALEKSAKKRGADAAYLNASPYGGTRGLPSKEAAEKLKKFYKEQGYTVAKDYGDNAMMYKKLKLHSGDSKPVIANPAALAQKVYDRYSEGLSSAASGIADKILDTTTPQGLPNRQKFIDDNKPVVSFGTEMIADPLNFIAPGAGAIAKIAKSGKAASKIAEGLKIADKAPEAVQFAKEGFRVVNSGQPALETALAKSLRNPEAVIADIQSRGSLSAAEKARIIERIKPSPEAAAKLQKVEAKRINVDPKQIKDQAHAYFEAIKNSN